MRTVLSALSFAIVAFAVIATITAPMASADTLQPPTSQLEPTQGIITVTGTGTVTAPPDTASVAVGVMEFGKDLNTAQTTVTNKGTAIKKVLTDAGIADKDIETSVYSIDSQMETDRNGNPTGTITYTVALGYTVTIHDLTKVGTILDGCVGAGANGVGNIRMFVENQDDMTQRAREAAIKNARATADTYATGSNSRIVSVLSIVETSAPIADSQEYSVAASAAGESRSAEATNPVPVTPGTSSTQVTVTVQFVIEPNP